MRSLVFCTTCRYSHSEATGADGRTGGQTLIDHMKDVVTEKERHEIRIETQACLWNCKRHCSVVRAGQAEYAQGQPGSETWVTAMAGDTTEHIP